MTPELVCSIVFGIVTVTVMLAFLGIMQKIQRPTRGKPACVFFKTKA
jgi:hypothetical protein